MSNRQTAPIYLDYQATTPTDPRVVDVMLPWFTEKFGNPHSADHKHGWEAAEAVDRARDQIARLIGAKGKEITFTSGATESNNLAIKGVARAAKVRSGRNHVLTLSSEHKCVLESVARLGEEGFDVTFLPVQSNGLVDLDALKDAVSEKTALVSIMAANNEIGVLQPLQEIGEIIHDAGALFHTDGAQAVGKIPMDVASMGIDLMSISGHKIYGPKGIGALYVRRRPKIAIEPLMDGGGQEKGLRSGTLAPPLCIGFGEACRLAAFEMAEEAKRLLQLRDLFLDRLNDRLPILNINGDMAARLPGNLSLTFDGFEASELLAATDGLSISTGSACSSGGGSYSHVLEAIGHEASKVSASVRIGFGRFTTREEVLTAADMLIGAVLRLSGGKNTA